jgi:hypothetical protein
MKGAWLGAPAAAAVSVVAAGLALANCTSLDGLARDKDDASSAQSSSGSSGAAGDGAVAAPDADKAAGDSSIGPLGPGQIVCASTMTVCDIRQAQCCISLSGTSSMAARTYTMSSALCGPIGAGCGSYVSNNGDFTMKLPQRCGSATDCSAGEACCVLPIDDANRYGKELRAIECTAAATCAQKGRALCNAPSDCAATENCLAETDPILSRLYSKFCR